MIQEQKKPAPAQNFGTAKQGQKPRRHGNNNRFRRRPEPSAIGQKWTEAPGLKPMVWKPEDNLKIIPLGG